MLTTCKATHNNAGHNRATSCAGLATLRFARLYRRRYASNEGYK
jgi:hypothetical protein